MRKIYIMSGTPASGKSTLIANESGGDIVLSRDMWRNEKRGGKYSPTEKAAWIDYINSHLRNTTQDIWIDQTTLGISALNSLLLNLIITAKADEVIIYVLNTPLDICIERNAKRPDVERVPEKQLRHMHDNHITNPITADGIRAMRLPYRVRLRVCKG